MSSKVATRRCWQEDLESSILSIAEEYGKYPLRKRCLGEIARQISKEASQKAGRRIKISSRKIGGILKKYSRKNGKSGKNGKIVAATHLSRRNNPCCAS